MMISIPPIDFSVTFVAAVAGIVLSLALTYIPGLNTWYAPLTSQIKSVIMLGLMAVCAVAIMLLAVYGIIQTVHPITWTDVVAVVVMWMVANQSTYKLAPLPNSVSHLIIERNQMLEG